MNSRWLSVLGSVALLALAGQTARADDAVAARDQAALDQIKVEHAECGYFGSSRDRFVSNALKAAGSASQSPDALSAVTGVVNSLLSSQPDGARRRSFAAAPRAGSIDSYIYGDLQANGIQSADKTTDWEFIRRVTLDLTGRIPSV